MDNGNTTKRILIMDDEPDIVTYFETLLNDNGYATLSAEDGIEGLEKARNEKPDLITLDISMPKKSGVRFYRELKSDPEISSIPVIIVTAVTDDAGDPYSLGELIQGSESLPAPQGCVSKPIDRDNFLAVIEKTLASTGSCQVS
ncbi:MAG: response regulator [candidate division Zixibacteria bacterium]|nr:response regulator [candidate division Zixibacteria bacterium]